MPVHDTVPDFAEQCVRAKVTAHQPPEHTGTVSFLRAVLALDAAQHPSSSARVLLDLAAALRGPGTLRWIREPLPAAPGERPSGAAGPLHAAVNASGAGANQIDLGSFNECVVIETVRLAGAITRGDIAARTRLTQQSVSRIARSLMERGLPVEDRKRQSAGKPSSLVRLRDDAAHAMGIHIDPEVLTAVVVDLSGRIVARRVEKITPEQRPGAVVAQIAALGESVLAGVGRQVRESSFLGLGVAVPGPVDTVSGTVLDPPLMSVLRDVPLRTLLERPRPRRTLREHPRGRRRRRRLHPVPCLLHPVPAPPGIALRPLPGPAGRRAPPERPVRPRPVSRAT